MFTLNPLVPESRGMEHVPGATTRRSLSDGLRAFAEKEASALFIAELARRQDEWRNGLGSVRQALADLEARYDTVVSGAPPEAPPAAVSALIDKIVTAAAAEAESLVQQVDASARAEIADAQALVRQLQADVRAGEKRLELAREQLKVEQAARAGAESATNDAETLVRQLEADVRAGGEHLKLAREQLAIEQAARAGADSATKDAEARVRQLDADVRAGGEQLKLGREQLAIEQAARARAESAASDAQVAHEQARSTLDIQVRSQEAELRSSRAEIAALQEQLAAAQAEGMAVKATLEALQLAVHGAMSTLTVAKPAAATPGGAAAEAVPGDRTRASVAPPAIPSAAAPSSTAHAKPVAIGNAPPAALPPNRYATALLTSIEAMYGQDVESALPPADIARRLRDNLRYASQLFAERLRSDPAGEKSALKEQTARLLRTKSGTPFGRDLALAAAEAERHEPRDGTAASQVPGKTRG